MLITIGESLVHRPLVKGLVFCLVIGAALVSFGCIGRNGRPVHPYSTLNRFACLTSGGSWNDDYGQCSHDKAAKSSAAVAPGGRLYITASAHVAGALGTNWRSDVQVDNLGDETAEFSIHLLEHGEDNSNPQQHELSLGPGESLRLGDVLVDEFGFEGQAALILAPSSGRITVTSRTYNFLGDGNDLGLPAGSTFGQYIPALTIDRAIAEGEEGRLIQLSHSFSDTSGSRTNLGLVNATSSECRVWTDFYTANGESLGRVTTTLAPLEYKQINKVFQRVTSTDVGDGYAVVSTPTDGGRFFAFASVVDNLTGDPVAITAINDDQAVTGEPITIVATAHVAGAGGTNWRTDLEVHNPDETTATYTIELLEHGTNNSNPATKTYTLAGGHGIRFPDVLATEFGSVSQAALRITATSGRVMVTSRTYNLLGSGNALGLPPGATFGQYIPGLSDAQAIGFGGEGRLIQLAHQTGGSGGFRTNLVLVNAVGSRIDTEIDLYTSDGAYLATVDRSLAPYEYRQINGIFGSVTGASVEDGYAVLRTTDEGGHFFALASVVDNSTGDPVGMAATEILAAETNAVVDGVRSLADIFAGVGYEGLLNHIESSGIEGILADLEAAFPDVATVVGDTLVIDYGNGYTADDGTVLTGTVTIDASSLNTSSGLDGYLEIEQDGLLIDGQPPLIGSTSWDFGLAERANGTIHGQISVTSPGGRKSAGSMTGSISIDTAICLEFPVSGSLTFNLGGEIVTVIFRPDCSGGIDHTVEPGAVSGSTLLALEWSFTGDTSTVGTIDTATGEWNTVGSSGFPRLNSLARSPSGDFYSVTEDDACGPSHLIRINPSTGAGTLVADIAGMPDEHYVAGLAFTPSGALYASVGNCYGQADPLDDYYRINPGTGAATYITEYSGYEAVSSLDYDQQTGRFFGWDQNAGLITVDPATGAVTDVGSATGGSFIQSLVVLPDGSIVGGQNTLYSIDRNTGAVTEIDGDLSNVRGMALLPD